MPNDNINIRDTVRPDLWTADITIQQWFGPRVYPTAAKAMKSHPGQNIFGVELEIENWNPDVEAVATGYTFTTDGSLRGSAVEAISHPNNKLGILATTEALWKKFGITERNFSERCSIHVHANVLDFTIDNLKTLMLVYATLEELLFKFIGQDRYKNIFCVPWSEAGVSVSGISSILTTPRGWQKYTALNLAPIRTQGTVEFRHMEGHASIGRLKNWLDIIDDILTYSRKTPYKEAFNTVANLNNTSEYTKWVQSVLPSSFVIFNPNEVARDISRGVIEAKLLTV